MKFLPRRAATAAVSILAVGALAACSSGGSSSQGSSGSSSDGDSTSTEAGAFPTSWDDPITIDVFDGLANYMGTQSGWFAKIVKDKFNMELNIIAPNVAGGGDTLYNTRVSAGDLGDLIITDRGQRMDELVQGGLLLDASEYYDKMSNLKDFDPAVQDLNKDSGSIYAFPSQVSTLLPTQPSSALEPTFGAYLRWDLYEKVGYPAIGSLEDLLPVFKSMQDAEPTAPNGKKTYAISLFADWDGNMMNNIKQPITYYGYDELGFVLAKADGSDYQGLLDDDGMYKRVLKFYFDANQQGLVDPESTTQNYDTLFSKYQNGQVLYSFWPWLGQTAYNTEDNTQDGRGFMLAEIEDQTIFEYGAEIYGGKQVFAIGSKAEDPERIAAFIDWLFSPEGVNANNSQTQGAAGPEGLTWDVDASGEPQLTDFGKEVFLGGDAVVPEEWGGGNYLDGVSALNISAVLPVSINPDTNFPFSYTLWPSYQALVETPLTSNWSEHMDNATSGMDFLEMKDQLMVAPGASYTAPADPSDIEALRNQVKAVIVENSWKAVFASNEGEFDKIWSSLQSTANGLGYEKVLEFDMTNAHEQNDAREAVAKEFG